MSDYPEQESRGIDARDVRPGMLVWNPYGGDRGYAVVTSEPRGRPDGTIEFDVADGRTGHFFPQSRLRLIRDAKTGPERAEVAVTGDGRDTQAVTTDGRITSLSEPKTGKAAAVATQAVLDAVNSGQLSAEQLEGCDFWTAKAAQQRMQAEAEVDPGPAERQLEDWNIHNDHADGLAADYDLDREA